VAALATFAILSVVTLPGALLWRCPVLKTPMTCITTLSTNVYVPGGEGVIYVFPMTDPDHYRLLSKVPTALGGRTAGYFGRQSKSLHRFSLAVPASAGQSAELRIYTVQE
jgi:hypothetical protein